LVVLVFVSLAVFAFRWLLPGEPDRALLGADPSATGAGVAALRRDYGLGSPAVVQYLAWLGQVLHGNLGFFYGQNTSVGSLLACAPREPAALATAVCCLAGCVWSALLRRCLLTNPNLSVTGLKCS
jgi:peptide/nickel transport system permease protein